MLCVTFRLNVSGEKCGTHSANSSRLCATKAGLGSSSLPLGEYNTHTHKHTLHQEATGTISLLQLGLDGVVTEVVLYFYVFYVLVDDPSSGLGVRFNFS